MKKIVYILILLAVVSATSCKKAKISRSIEGTWQLKSITNDNGEDVTEKILHQQIVYTTIVYGDKKSKSVLFSNPDLPQVKDETGTYELEKIVPTQGEKYYLIRNVLTYNYQRRKVFNIREYGSEVQLTEDNLLLQKIEDYTIIYTQK